MLTYCLCFGVFVCGCVQSVFSVVWGWVLTVMIGYFLLSTMTSMAQGYLIDQDLKKINELEAKKAKITGSKAE